MERNVELRSHVFNDAAETARDEEHLYATLMKLLHQLPEQTNDHNNLHKHVDTLYKVYSVC